VTISEHARSELIELLAVAPHRVTAVHCGVDAWWRATEDPAELAGARERAGLPARYLLSVGALEPRKNLALLIEAYALARRKGLTLPLVVAGPAGWRSREIRDAPRRHGVADHVLLVGHLSRSDLRAAYSQAEAFVFPSLYEGFGLPVLEAMACGTPVIASCSSSLPEVAGDAAVLVDPADPDALAAALERVVGDETLRSDLRRRGVQRAAGFSWDEAARQTVDAYRTALAG
jgi:glycosyltransferase involved in cell wall biosynthesis